MTQEEENQHIKKLKDAGFDCGSSRSIDETIQLLKPSKRRNTENLIKQATIKQADYIRLTAQIVVLKEIALDYSGKTIDNIIQQLEAIKKEVTDED